MNIVMSEHLSAVKKHSVEVGIASAEIRSVKVPGMVAAMVGDIRGQLVRAAQMLDKQSALMVEQAELLAQLARERE